MSGYLGIKTAEKLQAACDAITRACKMYEIGQLRSLGFITENDAKTHLKEAGIRFDDTGRKSQILRPSYIPTRIFAKILNLTNPDWFWYSNDIFTTSGPDGLLQEQSVHIDTALAFLRRNERYAKKVLNFVPKTEEELSAWTMLKEGLQ